jgi:hypothetical protein
MKAKLTIAENAVNSINMDLKIINGVINGTERKGGMEEYIVLIAQYVDQVNLKDVMDAYKSKLEEILNNAREAEKNTTKALEDATRIMNPPQNVNIIVYNTQINDLYTQYKKNIEIALKNAELAFKNIMDKQIPSGGNASTEKANLTIEKNKAERAKNAIKQILENLDREKNLMMNMINDAKTTKEEADDIIKGFELSLSQHTEYALKEEQNALEAQKQFTVLLSEKKGGGGAQTKKRQKYYRLKSGKSFFEGKTLLTKKMKRKNKTKTKKHNVSYIDKQYKKLSKKRALFNA